MKAAEVAYTYSQPESGAVTKISLLLSDPMVKAQLERMFNLRSNEQITQISFSDTLMTAQIEVTKQPV